MKFILISSENLPLEYETHIVNKLFEIGLKNFHLRKPNVDIEFYKNYLNKINSKFHSKIVIHDYYELMNEYNLKGIHFNKRNFIKYYSYLSNSYQKSISCHSFEEIEKFQKFNFDYLFISPIFNSISKENYSSNYNIDYYSNKLKSRNYNNIIALGGITFDKISLLKDAGFLGIAVLGDIWKNSVDKFEKLQTKFLKYKQLCN